jgi:hypothetical protein
MEFSFFTTDNKSGYKTNEIWISKNYPELHCNIIEYSNNFNLVMNFKEKIWFYFNKLTERPKCVTCGNEINFRNRFDKPYGNFCSLKCINENKEEMTKRQKETFNKKYGVDFYPEHPDFIKKQKKTKMERYGDENFVNIEKSKKTRLEKYGNENYVNIEKYKITCQNRYNSDNYSTSNTYKNKIISKYKTLHPNINFIDIGKLIVKIKCKKCGNESEITKQLLYEREKRNYDSCTHCNPIGQSFRSGYEHEIGNFLNELSVIYTPSSKIMENNQEIDIYIPDNKLGIEVNGNYWHNELFVTPDYHLKKTIRCNEKNIELIHIFEDEWVKKSEIIKSIIKYRLNKTDNTIFGRKCIINEVSSEISKKFLNENHIQGNVNSKVRLGLFFKNELVSLMTFSKGRVIMGGKEDEWELNRFVNKINTNIIGASSKLFKYFVKKYTPQRVISYSDIRLFNGKMYNSLGFIEKSQSKPNYWYVINGLRYYRFNFRKSILIKEGFDKTKSEREIMFDRKIYRIYDCGHIRWEYNLLNEKK